MHDDQPISLMGALKALHPAQPEPAPCKRSWVGVSIVIGVISFASGIGMWAAGLGGAAFGACFGVAVLLTARDACINSHRDR